MGEDQGGQAMGRKRVLILSDRTEVGPEIAELVRREWGGSVEVILFNHSLYMATHPTHIPFSKTVFQVHLNSVLYIHYSTVHCTACSVMECNEL